MSDRCQETGRPHVWARRRNGRVCADCEKREVGDFSMTKIRQADGELRSVAQMWDLYRDKVLSRDASPIQVSECRRAFYSGVQSTLLDGLLGIGDDSVSEAAAMTHLQSLHDECQAFAKAVSERRA